MPIDAKETEALAGMLRIGLAPGEAGRLAAGMTAALECAKAIDAVDVAGAVPMTVAVPGYAPLREDVPGESFTVVELESFSGGRFDPQTGSFVAKPIFQ